jgi:1-pyrroline-5-carboxylate dehydrogenase
LQANPKMTLFTGSSRVAEKLAADLKGRVKLEDAGFDWKILGRDVQEVRSHIYVQHLKLYSIYSQSEL